MQFQDLYHFTKHPSFFKGLSKLIELCLEFIDLFQSLVTSKSVNDRMYRESKLTQYC